MERSPDGDLILDKVINGKKEKLSFTILEPSKDLKVPYNLHEDAKKAGVEVKIKVIEWNTFIKSLNERKFEAVRLGWSAGSIDIDPNKFGTRAQSPVVDSIFLLVVVKSRGSR